MNIRTRTPLKLQGVGIPLEVNHRAIGTRFCQQARALILVPLHKLDVTDFREATRGVCVSVRVSVVQQENLRVLPRTIPLPLHALQRGWCNLLTEGHRISIA